MLNVLWAIFGLLAGVIAVDALARRVGAPAPIMLLLAGFAASFVPGVPSYEVDPELVLTVLIPPLLYAAALESSMLAIKRLVRPIVGLAVVMVLITALAVAVVLHAIVPAIPFAAALALGAVVAPPDAVATVAIARRVGLPRQLVTVLEGESLFNDATSLVILKVAIAGIAAGSLELAPAVTDFAWEAGGGLLLGFVAAAVISVVRRRLHAELPVTVVSLVTPYFAYLIAEAAHTSGVLAVVIAGLVLGYRTATDVSAQVRLTENATWQALRFALEGAVFALIGLQLWELVAALNGSEVDVAAAVVGVLATVILVRPVWIFLGNALGLLLPGGMRRLRWQALTVVSWAGMRGVISLAAVQTLPTDTPHRSLLIVCAVAVIAGTLLLQGLTLPALIRRLGVGGASDELAALDARDSAQRAAVETAHEHVDELVVSGRLSPANAERARQWIDMRQWRAWDRADGPSPELDRLGKVRAWQRAVIDIEREVFLEYRDRQELPEETLREIQHDLDLEEALLDRGPGQDEDDGEGGHLETLPDGERLGQR